MAFTAGTDDVYYHVFNKSISNYRIFSRQEDALRFEKGLIYYNAFDAGKGLGYYLQNNPHHDFGGVVAPGSQLRLKILCYCIMPDHYHLVLRATSDNIISRYISLLENSYTRYFNIKNDRKGPLWQNRFKKVPIDSNETLLHVTRYVHLNPVTAHLVEDPESWMTSSYRDYVINDSFFEDLKEISIRFASEYKRFVMNNKDFQRKLRDIKKHQI